MMISSLGARRAIAVSMGLLAICMTLAPLSPGIAIAVGVFAIMGSSRGVSSVAMNTTLMEQVPKHFMGRVQNTFYFAGTLLQIVLALLVGGVAQYNLAAGFAIIGMVYAVAFVSAVWPVGAAVPVEAGAAN
jgi:MFS family permease